MSRYVNALHVGAQAGQIPDIAQALSVAPIESVANITGQVSGGDSWEDWGEPADGGPIHVIIPLVAQAWAHEALDALDAAGIMPIPMVRPGQRGVIAVLTNLGDFSRLDDGRVQCWVMGYSWARRTFLP